MIEPISTLALSLGSAWASGLRLYLVVFILGLLERLHPGSLPASLHLLSQTWILGVSASLAIIEFLVDKVPWLDSLWDTVHTFIRVPAGALLAAASIGHVDPLWTTIAALVGGGLALGSHSTKTATRLALNASPEPLTNWAASTTEDVSVLTGMWLVFAHPLVFLGLLLIFIALMAWLWPKLWRLIRGRRKAALVAT